MRAAWIGIMTGLAALACAHTHAAGYADLPDPTRPNTVRAAPRAASPGGKPTTPHRAALTLQSTLISSERRIAIINGHAVSEGATLDGVQIITIRPAEVLINQDGTTRTLRLLTEGIAQRTPASMESAHE